MSLCSFIVFALTNPYILINFSNFFLEANNEYSWVLKKFNLNNVLLFFNTSYVLGFGILLSLITIFFSISEFTKKKSNNKKIILLTYLLFLFGAAIGSYDLWHIQFRYIPYILPISLIYLALKIKNRKFILFVFFATFLQAVPMKLAYYDEDSIKHSTRLNAASWINRNIIEKNKSICRNSFAPYNFPPVNFNKIKISENCNYEVQILREPKKIIKYKESEILKKFEPRYQFINVPLVFSHINPLIIIIKNSNE